MLTPSATSRACGTCTLCCRLPDIEELQKPANMLCRHGMEGRGCSIYETRPQGCRDFWCLWRSGTRLGEHWNPVHSHMMVYVQGPQVTVLVEPDHAKIWRQPPYHAELTNWASELQKGGGYIIVFAGDVVTKIAPPA